LGSSGDRFSKLQRFYIRYDFDSQALDDKGVLMGCWVSKVASHHGVAALLLAMVSLACGRDSSGSDPALPAPADAGAPDAALPLADVDLTGTWLGTLQVPPTPLRFVLNIERAVDGSWTGTADSPDQFDVGRPITSIVVTGIDVRVRLDSAGLEFAGRLSEDGQSLVGAIEQSGGTLPLALERQAGPLDYRRPQDPVPPLPYETRDVTFASEAPGVTLAGTLSWPEGPGPFATVVLITGSGAQNRNEELLNHRPFLVLSDALARANVAVLRYDDRGVGESTGDFASATTLDFADDARGAIRYLRSQTTFPVASVGLVGHSEGGLIAPLVADGNADVSFLVLLAGPSVDGATIILSQGRAIGAADGATPADLDASEAQQRAAFTCLEDPAAALAGVDACLRQALAGLTEPELNPLLAQLESPWMRWFLTYDPAPVLRRTSVPVLALNGSLDLQVLASVNVPVMEAAFQEAGNERASVFELPGLNHLFQHAVTGSPSEYGPITETMAPEVLTQIAGWIGSLPTGTASGDAGDAGASADGDAAAP
jgi:alpha-beta hydrolase superfamily lysophospholipase